MTSHPRLEFDCVSELVTGQTRTILLKLTAPVLAADAAPQLAALDFTRARATTVQYWQDWQTRGAHFDVPEETVNDLFRANLWHALSLPRYRTDENGVDRIDLPYSNFAYGQYQADWPVNQAVYVDYMIHGLRGIFRRGRGGIRSHLSQPTASRRASGRLRQLGRVFAEHALLHRPELSALG